MARCKECGRFIKQKYYERTGVCYRCYTTPDDDFTPPPRLSFFPSIGGILIFCFVFLFIIMILGFFDYSSTNNFQEHTDNTVEVKETPQKVIPVILPEVDEKINADFPYWASKTITYSFSSNFLCNADRINNIREAFSILHDNTNGLLSFVEGKDGDIVIRCFDDYASTGEAGSSGASISEDYELSDGTVNFYLVPSGAIASCETYPTLELHEILHVLGFRHDFSSEYNIMYLASSYSCRKLDTRIVECLKNVYSTGKGGSSCEGIPHVYNSPFQPPDYPPR